MRRNKFILYTQVLTIHLQAMSMADTSGLSGRFVPTVYLPVTFAAQAHAAA